MTVWRWWSAPGMDNPILVPTWEEARSVVDAPDFVYRCDFDVPFPVFDDRADFDAEDVDADRRELAERFADQAGTTAGAEREIMDAMEEGES